MPFGGEMPEHLHDHAGHSHGYAHSHDHRGSLLLGISLHKVTESLVFAALLISSGVRLGRALLLLLLFALMAPLGAFSHFLLIQTEQTWVAELTPKVTGILIGILLHVSTTIIFESEEGHKFNWWKFLAIIIGIGMAALVS
jgi:zinc transporter ZupT